MNPKMKLHQPSPFVKCKSRRVNSEEKKIIKGKFIAEVNIQEICDETSEEEGSSITESETSKTAEYDDVFKSSGTAVSEAEETTHSPTEVFRRSEKQQEDAWSLCHIREDSISSPTKGGVDDILPSPKRRSRSDSEETPKTSDRPAGPKIHPVSPYIEEMKHFSSMLPCDDQTVLEYQTGKESEFSQKVSERRRKGIFDSTRIVDPEIGTTSPPHFDWGDLSQISGSTLSSQRVFTKKLKSSEKGILSKEFSGGKSMPKVVKKPPFLKVKFKDVQKTIVEETSFAKKPPNLDSVIQSKNLSSTLTVLQVDDDNKKEKLWNTPKGGVAHKLPKRDIFLQGKSGVETTKEIASQLGPFSKDSLEKSFSGKHISTTSDSLEPTHIIETNKSVSRTPPQNIFTENVDKSIGATFVLSRDGNQSEKTAGSKLLERKLHKTKTIHDSLKEKSLSAAHLSIPTGNIPSEYVQNSETSTKSSKEKATKSSGENFKKDCNQSKKTSANKLLKRRKNLFRTNANDCPLKEKSLSAARLPMATENIPTESVESSRAPSTNSSKKNEAKSTKGPTQPIKNSHKVKKTSTTLIKKNLHQRKEKALKEKRLSGSSAVSTKDSIRNFIASTEHEESIEKHSSETSGKLSLAGTGLYDSEDSWKSYAASKMMKRKETCFKIQKPLEESEELEKEIAATPNSTTNEDSIDYMDTSETESSNAPKISENSTEKFLEEMGLYESEQSTETESSKSKKRKKNLKKRKFRKDSLEEKSLEVRLREYKHYIKNIPICDLSLKKWRDKKEKHGV